jgi:hypothetical protein
MLIRNETVVRAQMTQHKVGYGKVINSLFKIMIVKTEEEISVKISGFIAWCLTQDHS